jgi:exosortase
MWNSQDSAAALPDRRSATATRAPDVPAILPAESPAPGQTTAARTAQLWADWRWALPLVAGFLAMALATLQGIAAQSWSTEQGAHGPIVLALALWLTVRSWPAMVACAVPGRPRIGVALLVPALLLYIAARVVGSIVIESAALYLVFIASLYLIVGARAMRIAWFPIAFWLFVLPPPGSWVATATQPLRLQLSELSVWGLSKLGYPVARSGLNIIVDQYHLEVKAACGGLNSMISLTAMGLFYAHLRQNSRIGYNLVLIAGIIVMAILANLVRVTLVILMTYHLGQAAAEGFLHQFAGLTMFAVAMGGVLLLDEVLSRTWRSSAPPAAI